jgi:hypothetical protein|nr:MAG TPA: Inorganic Pyrophosphatase [Caudoviricetes sp.]
MDDNIKKLHQALIDDGYDDVGTEQEFRDYVSDSKNVATLYNALSEAGYDNFKDQKSLETYLSAKAPVAQKPSTPQSSGQSVSSKGIKQTQYPQEVIDAFNSPDNKPGNFKDLAQLNDEYQRGELKKPGIISQALGMFSNVDAGNVGKEQKVGGMIANMLLGDNMKQPQQTQQPQDNNQQVQQQAQKEASPESKEEVPVTTPTSVVNNEGLMDAKLANYLENWKQRPDKEGDYFENMVADLLADGTANSNEEAVSIVKSALGRYANRSAMDVTNQVVSSLPDDTVQDAEQSIGAQWYSHGVQDKLKQEADSMGISYDDYVAHFLKPAMVQSLVNKYGPNYRNIAEGIATRLYAHDENVQDRLMKQDIDEALLSVISKYVNPSVVEEYNKAQEEGSKAFNEGMEGSQYIPANLRLGTALGAQYEANQAKDPQKILSRLMVMNYNMLSDSKFRLKLAEAATNVALKYHRYGEYKLDPDRINGLVLATVKNELDQLEIKGMMPKGSAEYIMKTGLGNTIVGKITRKIMQTDYQNWLEDIANQQYQPGFWENVASGALTFAGDAWSYWLPGAAGGKLTKSMLAKAEGRLAGDLMAKGMESRMAARAAKLLIGKSKTEALKSGAVHGAVTFGGQSAISKPIDEKYRTGQFDENGKIYNPSGWKIALDTLLEGGKQSALGVIMQGNTIANMIGKGRGLATNILADIGGKVADSGIMTGHQMLERMAQDPNFKPTGKDAAESFLESMANLTAIGLPGMVGKYARFKDAREFNKKYDFTDQDIAELKRFGYEDLRDAFEKVGIEEYAVEGENAQRLDGQLTQKYMNLMNDKSVPEVLKAKMMAVVEGKRPSSFSPVVDSVIVQPMDNGGKAYLETLNKDGGIIERKEYSSLDEAQKADKKLEYEKTLGLASVLEGEFHNEFTQEHLDGLYNQAAQKYNMGEKLTDEDKAAVYLHQNAGAIKDIMDKQQKGIILTEEEQKQVDTYRHFYNSALENSSVMREFVNTFEDSHGVARGTLRKALESKDKKYAPLVESYLKELYNSIELKREMKQTVDDLYNTAHGNEQKRIEQSGIEGEKPAAPVEGAASVEGAAPVEGTSSVEGTAGGQEPPVSAGPAPYQDRTNSVPSPSDANSSVEVATSDAFVMGQEAYKNGDSDTLKAIDYNSDLATGRLKRAFANSDTMFDLVTKAYNEGRDMEQFVAQRAGNLTPAQKEAISKYVEAMDAKKGAIDALQHADDGYREALKEQLWPYQTEDGNIVPATLTSGKQVFLKKANEYGGGFVVVPDEQGQPTIKQVSDAEIKEVGTPVSLDEYIESSLAQQKEARARQFISQFDGSGLKPNDRVAVAMEEGDENIDMTFAGYSEDGKIVLTDGKDNIALTREEFDTWRTNALNNTINERLNSEDEDRELAEMKNAEADKQERYKKGIFGYASGQPDYSDTQTDPKVAAEYLQETAGDDRKALFANIVAEKQALQKRINQLREHIASNEEWLSINADLDPKNAETRTLANKQMEGQITDLQARFDNWNKIRSAVMTPEEAQAIKADRTQKIADAGVNEGDVAPIEGREVAVFSDEELKKQYPTMDEASDFIASERKRIYRIQSDEVQREIDGVDKVLDRYVNGEIDLEPEQIKELNTTKAQLEARQANLTESAKELKAQADKLKTLYRKENMEARAKAVEDMTPAEQRAIKVENAIKNGNMNQLNSIYEEVRGATDFNDTEPNTLEEYVANNIGRFTLNYEGKEKGGAFSNGIQQETGLGRKDFEKLQILAKKGEGKTVPEFVHSLYDDMPMNLKQMGYTDHDIRSAFLDLIGSAQSYSDIKNYTLNNKVANVEQLMRDVERQEEEMKENGTHSEAFDKIVELAKEQKEYWDLMEQGEVDPDDVPEVDVAYDMDELLKTLSDEEFKEVSDVLKGIDEEFEYFTADEYERREGTVERKKKVENANAYEESIKQALKPVTPFAYALKSAVESGDKKAVKKAQKELTDALIASDLGHDYLSGQLAQAKLAKKKDELYKVKRATIKPLTDAIRAIESAENIENAPFADRLKNAIAETETEPTEAQKKAGNYKKGHLTFGGYDFTVETPKGVTRSGKDEQGKPWSVTMHDTYGYILGKIGVDGDHIDMFINDAADLDTFDGNVYVVDQVNPETNEFDEHKVMYGYPSEEAATEAYLANYSKGWKGLGKVTSVPKAAFDKWLQSSDRKTKPFADYAIIKKDSDALSGGQKDENLPFAQMNMDDLPFHRDVKEVKPSDMTEAQKVAYDAVSTMLKKAGIPVKVVSNEDMEKVAEAQDNLNLAILLNHPEMRFKIKTPEEKQAAENAYNYAKELRPNKWAQYAVVDMSNPNKMPEYYQKQELARKERTYLNRLMWGNYKVFNLDKSFEDNVAGLTGSFPSEFDPYKIDEQTSKKNELKKQIKETEEAYKSTGQERKEYQNQLMKEYMDEHGLASENDIPDDVWREFDYKAIEKYQDKLDSLFAKYKDLDRQLKAIVQPGVQYLKGKGVVYGYTDGKEIVLNQEHLNPNTPIHEYQHLWRTAAKEMNPELIAHGDELIKQTQLFRDLKEDPNYMHLSDDEICDEAFARLTGEDGAAILEQMAKDAIKENPLDTAKELTIINRLKNWLKKFWYWTLDTFTKWKPEDIKRMTLEDIRNLVLRDLANGVDPRTVMNEKKEGAKLSNKEKDDATERIDKRIAELNRQEKEQSLKSENGNLAESHDNGYLPSKDNLDGVQSVAPSSAKIDKKFPTKTFYLGNLANFITSMGKNADITAGNFTKKLFEGMGMTPHGKDTQVSEYFKYQTDDGGKTTVRLSDHSGNALSIIKKGGRADKGYSIVVRVDSSPKTKFKANKYSNVAEYVYENPNADGLKDIARSVFNLIDTGEYLDLAGANEVHVSPRNNNSETAKENGGNLSVEDKIKGVSQQFGVDEADVAMYANAVKKGSTAEAARARANIKRHLMQVNEGNIFSFKDVVKYTKPINEALKENFGDLDAMIEERRKQVEAERNAMEAARKRAEEEEAKRKKHLEELSLIPDDQLDKQYMDALAKGDDATAREMLDEAARRKGYDDTESAYQGVGAWAAPGNPGYESDKARRDDWESSGSDVNLEDMALGYTPQPDDYFSHPERYSQNTPHGLESVKAINTAIYAIKNGEKDVKVKVYRAVPTSVKEGKLRNGDWVTPSKKYADIHGNNRLEGKYRIIEDEVPATQLWWDGNDANEFGFDDGKAYKYKNAKNNRKLNDLVTYDDEGDVIPPSKRFNSRKQDVRFHRVTEPEELERLNKEKTFEKEKARIASDAKEKGSYMLAPNGKKSKLDAEQWATVRTTNFKKWFGDWENDPENASKVVDENGEPMVVYHGRSADFNTFEKKEGVRFIMGLEDKVKAEGFFFSPDRALAEEFAGNAARHRGGKANVVPCYLNIRKPMDLTGEDYDRIYEDVTGWDYTVGMDTQDNLWGIMDEEGMADKIKAKGYDGAIFVEEVDDNYEPTKISYCALDANQIKSADKNNGEFSSRNNDIRFRFGEPYDYEKYPLGRVEPNLATKEVKIVHTDANHGFKDYKEAKNWAIGNICRTYTSDETGNKGEVIINKDVVSKYVSKAARDQSDNDDVHYAVLKVLPDVIREGIEAETHPNFNKVGNARKPEYGYDNHLLIHRVYGAVDIDGVVYRVKITMKENMQDRSLPNKPYSYEVTDISTKIEPLEAIDAQVQDHGSHSYDSISGTNLLKKVEMSYDKGKKLLDESEKMGISIENQRKIADSVVNTANKLGGAEATVYSSLDDVPEEYRSEVEQGAKGWYDPETHTVHVYLPNCEDGNDAQRTVFHEKIGHEGMEVLLGGEDEVRKFANFVYNSVAASTRGKILEIANEYDPDWKKHDRMNVGTQEYIARLAEEGPKTAEDFSLWTKIKHYLIKVLKKLGIRVPGLLNDKDLRYYLMKAGKALHVWDKMPQEKQEAMMKQASNAEIKDALSDGAGKGKPRQKKGESMVQYMKRVQEWRKWKNAREDENDPEPPMFYDIDKDEAGKKEWAQLNKDWRERHHLVGEEPTGLPIRMEGEEDGAYMTRIHEYEKWKEAMKDQEDPMPDMFAYEKKKQEEVKRKYEDWLARHELLEQQQADLDLYEGKIYPAETNPKADDLEQQVMQDLAEVTSTDVSKEGAAKTVKHAVIHRRKNMEEASADDAIYINDVKNRIEKMADSGAFDKLLSDYQGKPNRAEKLAEAIPYIIEAPRRLRDLAHDLNATGVFDKGHIHIQPADVEAIQPYVADLIAETGKKHTELRDGKEVEVYDDPQAVSEVASKMAQVINDNHQGEEGFVPIDGTDILSEHVLPLVKQQIVPEGIDYKNISPEMQAAIDSIRDWYNYTYDWLKDNRTLKEDTGYNVDYVNHIWDKEKSDKQAYAMYVENRQRTKSPNEKPRTISTLMEGISVGLVPKTTDITKMMAYYSRSNIEAWVNKTMLQELSGLNVIERNEDGEIVSSDPLLSSTPPFNLEQYQYFEIPGVGPVWVYNVSPKQVKVKNPITGKERVLYSEASAGDRFGVVFETYQSSPFWKAFDTLASSAKKLELGFSGFHAGALTEVYMVQNMVEFGPKKAMANFMKYIFADTMKNHELPCFANPEDFQEAATHLVKFGATNDYAAADVQNMFDNMRDAMMKVQEKLKDRNGISGTVALATMPLKVATQMLSLINKGMDRALWDFLHDGLKLATYRMRADKTKERAKKKGWTEEELSRALDEDGQFVNDMFGGQHWDILGASHRTLRYAGRVLLSPDWNASTTRHFLALTGYGSIWNEATFENFKQYYSNLLSGSLNRISRSFFYASQRNTRPTDDSRKYFENLSVEDGLTPNDEGRRSRQISALLCYGIGFMVFYEGIANGINAAFRALDEEKERKKAEEMRKTNPNYRSMYELAYGDEGMKWYDYLMRGNSLGQQSKIFLGRYKDGTEMYVRHGKQFREVPEYLFNHKGELEFPGPMVQRMIGKANPMVRMTLDDINYLSDFQASHADQEIQRKYGKTIGLLYKDALYWAPFLIPSQENKEFKAVDFFFPSSKGFSPWKAQSYFKDFILSGDMEGVVMTYQSCQRNGIDPEAQIKAAIGSVKALESAEMSDGVTSLQEASKRFDAAKSITEKKKMRQKMKKFLSQSDYKAFTQKEALDMVQSYLNGEDDLKEMEKAENKYLMKAKSEDVTEDWRIQNAWNGTMETYQEYQRLKDIDKAKANAFKNSKTNKRLFAARKAISAAKKKMNKAKKQMDGTNGAAKMVEIRKTRKELLNTLNGME